MENRSVTNLYNQSMPDQRRFTHRVPTPNHRLTHYTDVQNGSIRLRMYTLGSEVLVTAQAYYGVGVGGQERVVGWSTDMFLRLAEEFA